MGILKLRSLRLHGFRSFDDATFEFPDSGMVLVDGVNRNTKGSSGSGKTSVLLGLAYAFGYCPFPGTELQSWNDPNEPMWVEVVAQAGDDRVVLTRGVKTTLKVGSARVLTGAAAVERRLRELVGYDPDVLEAVTYRQQGEPGTFLRRRNAEKMEFLVTVLGLQRYEEVLRASNKKGEELERSLARETEALTRAVASADNFVIDDLVLEDEQMALSSVADARAYLQGLVVQGLETSRLEREAEDIQARQEAEIRRQSKEELHQLEVELQALSDVALERLAPISLDPQTESDLKVARDRLEVLQVQDQELRSKHEQAHEAQRDEWRELNRQGGRIPQLEDEKYKCYDRMKKLSDNTCPTCGQEWADNEKEKQVIRDKVDEIEKGLYEARLAGSAAMLMSVELKNYQPHQPDPRIAQYTEVVNQLTMKLAMAQITYRAQEDMFRGQQVHQADSIRQQIQTITCQVELAIATSKEPVRVAKANTLQVEARRDSARYEVQSCEQELARRRSVNELRQRAHTLNVQRHQEVHAAIAAQRQGVEQVQSDAIAERDFSDFLRSWLQSYVEEILDAVANETNKILAVVPNTQHCSIRFLTESTSDKGTTKKEIVPRVTVGEHEARSLKSGLSGGMLTAVDVAVDVAVASVIRDRVGTYPGWLALDEPFDGLGKIEKEACLEILSRYADDRLVLVVDHGSEFKEMFRQVVMVTHQDGVSTVS